MFATTVLPVMLLRIEGGRANYCGVHSLAAQTDARLRDANCTLMTLPARHGIEFRLCPRRTPGNSDPILNSWRI